MDFIVLARAFQELEETSSRLQMTDILADLFKRTRADEIDKIVYLLQGRVAPAFEPIEIGMGEKFVQHAISTVTGYDASEVEKLFKKRGDLGTVAETLTTQRKQRALASETLTVARVFSAFTKIAKSSGAGSQDSKISLLAELLNSASPVEAKYLVRIPLGQLRLGIGDPTIIDAFSVKQTGSKQLREKIERAYNLCSDLGEVAKAFWSDGEAGMEKFKIRVGSPVRPALAERLPSAQEIIKKLGKCAAESKYDGFRIAVHKKNDKVTLFSRRLENVTHMFPEVVKAAQKAGVSEAIFEGEALAFNEESGEYLPFQQTMQRKRKHDVARMAEAFPLKLFVFDVLYADGKDLTQKPFAQRRAFLEKVFRPGKTMIMPSELLMVDDAKELDKFFEDCVSRGLEGVICKDLQAPYVTGARKFAWIKLKRSYRGELSDTIDVVIVGYYKGRGVRAGLGVGALLTAVYDDKADVFRTVARVGSGISEEQIKEFKALLDKARVSRKPGRVDALHEPDVWVEPKHVITVNADEITLSPTHTCGRKDDVGYALRFPRMVGAVRIDKKPEDATTVREIVKMYGQQKRVSLVAAQNE